MNRRLLLKYLATLPALSTVLPALSLNTESDTPLRIGLTPVILDDQLSFLDDWKSWFESRLQRPVRFIQRQKYRDISELLLASRLDAAWVCGYPYVRYRPRMKLLAVPRYKGSLYYHSYIICHKNDSKIKDVLQLKNHIFAYSDPDSNSGYLYPQYHFQQLGISPDSFFSSTFFSWSHRNTIDAVAHGLADAGAVDSYIWEQYQRHHPEVVNNTRIIERSPAFGFPPFVVRADLDPAWAQQLYMSLHQMNQDEQGKKLLQQLGIEGFDAGSEQLFSNIEKMMLLVRQQHA